MELINFLRLLEMIQGVTLEISTDIDFDNGVFDDWDEEEYGFFYDIVELMNALEGVTAEIVEGTPKVKLTITGMNAFDDLNTLLYNEGYIGIDEMFEDLMISDALIHLEEGIIKVEVIF